jgi:hypothetical protein
MAANGAAERQEDAAGVIELPDAAVVLDSDDGEVEIVAGEVTHPGDVGRADGGLADGGLADGGLADRGLADGGPSRDERGPEGRGESVSLDDRDGDGRGGDPQGEAARRDEDGRGDGGHRASGRGEDARGDEDGRGEADRSDEDGRGEADPAGEDGDLAVVNYEDRLVEALPELARLAAVAGTRTVAWSLRMGLRAGARLARATVDPQAAAELAHDVGTNMREYARDVLGVTELEERVRVLTPVGHRFASGGTGTRALAQCERPKVPPEILLRAQGAELLRQSADVDTEDHVHPAFGRILGELAPDEGRILRLLDGEGPQPVVDVRAASLIGKGSQLVVENLNMVAMPAGCRHPSRIDTYLTNLQRLGLVRFANEPLEDEIAYQVLEAQGHVLEAIKSTGRAKTIQRTLRLTPFGEAFCAACLPGDFSEVKELTEDPGPAVERAAAPRGRPTEEELETGEPPADELLQGQLTPSENNELGS